jgi:CheY-like chemotaxis protein
MSKRETANGVRETLTLAMDPPGNSKSGTAENANGNSQMIGEPVSVKGSSLHAILIVDDSIDDSDKLRSNLLGFGASNPIRVVSDYRDAVAYLQGTSVYSARTLYPFPAVIFVDLRAPGMDGFDFLTWLKERRELSEGILVVAVGDQADPDPIQRAHELGAQSYLTKPFDLPALKNLVTSCPRPLFHSR